MRASLLFVAGALAGGLVGGAGTYLAVRADGLAATLRAADDGLGRLGEATRPAALSAFDSDGPAGDAPAMSTSDRLALYEYTAASSSPEALESLIQTAASLPPSPRRSFELDALLTRFAERDAPRAARFARALRLETEFLVPVFRVWAERDARAALDELRSIDNPAAVRTIALAMLDVFGDDERGIARLESVLSGPQMRTLRVDAVLRLAGHDPYRALRRALSLGDFASRSAAISGIAREWARQDPAAAIAQVDVIDERELRPAYQSGVIAEWARIDPEDAFAYLRSSGGLSFGAGLPVLQSLASADPEAVLAFAEELPLQMRSFARQAAIGAIAERDPSAAIELLDGISSYRERDQLISAIAAAYARRDPEAALEWARSLLPESASAVAAAVSRIAEIDPDRALDLAFSDDPELGSISSIATVNAFAALDPSRLAGIADRLVARGDFRATGQIQTLLSAWSARDPNAALEWLLVNVEVVDRATLSSIAAQLASSDPEAAIRAVDRLPADLRGDWIAQAAGGYAEHDPEAATTWVMQYEGQPGFDAAIRAVAWRTANSDPQTAVRLLERTGRPIELPIAAQIASTWAVREPVAAAEWVMRLPGDTRSSAIGAVASGWSARDPDAAKRWALSLPAGTLRDQALGAMVPSTLLRNGTVDTAIMNAFSSDAARQNVVVGMVLPLAGRNREEARQLVDAYITDPRLRQQAYDAIDGTNVNAGVPNGFFAPSLAIRVK